MENYWTIITQIAVLVVGLLGGAATVPLIRWMKATLNTNGGQTLALVAVVSGLLAAATAVLEGVATPGGITPETFGYVFLLVFGMAQARYRQIKDELDAEDSE
jgi:hypothetical protein